MERFSGSVAHLRRGPIAEVLFLRPFAAHRLSTHHLAQILVHDAGNRLQRPETRQTTCDHVKPGLALVRGIEGNVLRMLDSKTTAISEVDKEWLKRPLLGQSAKFGSCLFDSHVGS
jgi:hypothetical protein